MIDEVGIAVVVGVDNSRLYQCSVFVDDSVSISVMRMPLNKRMPSAALFLNGDNFLTAQTALPHRIKSTLLCYRPLGWRRGKLQVLDAGGAT